MLLLVLILVVIAFGLLVVALLTGSVLWAWVSVGVSVVAAIVLLVDGLQRRSAVKAGGSPVAARPSRPMPMADMDPATEVLPVVPPSGRRGSGTDGPTVDRSGRVADAHQTVVMPVVEPSGSPSRPSGADATVTSSGGDSSLSVTKSGTDRSSSSDTGDGADEVTRSAPVPSAAAADATVSVSRSAVASSGDTSSAAAVTTPRNTSSEGAVASDPVGSKPSLTKAGPPGDAPLGESSTPGGEQAPAAENTGSGSAPDSSGSYAGNAAGAPEPGTITAAGSPPATADARESGPATPPSSVAEETVLTALPAATSSGSGSVAARPAEAGTGATAAAPGRTASGSDVEKTVSVAARPPRKPSDAAPAGAPSADAPSGGTVGAGGSDPAFPAETASDPEQVSDPPLSAAQIRPAQTPPVAETVRTEAPPAESVTQGTPIRQDDISLFGAPSSSESAADARPEPPIGPPGEAPEEPHDPIAAEIVGGLEDEVVVVDEQPRYHVASCRALAATAVIPLPVREAVELGFTPCGWCSPDRTLAGRHRTAAR